MLDQREIIGLKGNMPMGASVDLKTTKKEAKKLKRKLSKPSKENETLGDWPNSSVFLIHWKWKSQCYRQQMIQTTFPQRKPPKATTKTELI